MNRIKAMWFGRLSQNIYYQINDNLYVFERDCISTPTAMEPHQAAINVNLKSIIVTELMKRVIERNINLHILKRST